MNKAMFLVLAAALTAAAPVSAQKTAKSASASPKVTLTAAQVLDKATEASGGLVAAGKITSSVSKGTINLPAMGIKGVMNIQAKAPNKFYMKMNIDGVGETIQGFDGKTAWSKDPIFGLRELKGSEAAQIRVQAESAGQKTWKDLYTKAEMLGLRKVGNISCYALKVTSKVGGGLSTQFYDAKTFLLIRTDAIIDSPQGKIPTESYMSDYRTVDGVKVPFKLRQIIAGQQEIITLIGEIKNNVPVDDSVFVKPAEEPSKPAKG